MKNIFKKSVLLFIFLNAALITNAQVQKPVIQVGSEIEFPPYAFIDENGQPAGFSIDLIKAVADEMSLPIFINTGSWDEMWNGLIEGRFDVLPAVAKTPERETLADLSLPHTETFDAFFVRDGDPVFKNLSEAQGKEIVVMKSDAAHHGLLELKFQGTPVPVETIPEGLSLVASGKHDVFLCSKLIGVLTIQKHDIKGLTAGPLIPDYKRVFSFGVKKGSDELREKLNQGLAIVKSNGEYERIYEKWIGSPIKPAEITLTDKEKAWIENHPVINFGFTATFPPFSFLGEDNQPTGMATDYLEIIRKSTGINFQITEKGTAEKIYAMLRAKQIDGIPYNLKTSEREQYQNFSKPYITTHWIVVTRNDYPFIGSIKDLKGKKVGVIKSGAADELMKKQAGIELIEFNSQKSLWESVSFGETDAGVQILESAGYFISKLRITNLKVAYSFTEKLELGFSVRKDMPELIHMINKALDTITPEEHAETHEKWISLRYEQGVNWRTVLLWMGFITAVFLSVLITTLIWNRRLAKEIIERRRIEQKLKERVKELICLSAIRHEMQRRFSIEEFCNKVVKCLIPAMQFPEITRPVIELSGKQFPIGESVQELTHYLQAEIKLKDQNAAGHVRVYYTEDRPFLIPDEQTLIDSVAHAVGIFIERSHTEEILRQSEKQFRAMFENHHAVMLLIDPENGKIVRANTAAEKYYGYSSEQFEDMAISHIYQLTKEEIVAEMAKAKTELRNYFHFPHQLANGEIRDVEVHSSPILFKGKILLFSIVHDITERRRAEAELRKNQIILEKAEQISNQGSWEWDIVRDEWLFSKNWLKIHGYSHSGISKAELMEIAFPDDTDRIEKAFNDALAGHPYDIEHRIIRQNDKDVRFIKALGEVTFDDKQVPVRIFGSAQDITDRKHAEDALRESEQQFRAMFENHYAIMLLIDPENGRIIRANRGAENFYGYTAAEFENLTIQQINQLNEEEIASVFANVKTEKRNYFHFPHKLANGEIRDVEVHSSPIPFKGKTILFPIIHDITERRRAEEALLKSEEKYRTLVDTSISIILEWDPQGNILYLNKYGLEFFGFAEDEILGRNVVGTIVPPQDSTGYDLLKKMDDVLRNPDEYRTSENENIRKNGERVWIAWTNKSINSESGQVIKTLSIGIDRTRQKHAENALRKSEERYRKAQALGHVGNWEYNIQTTQFWGSDEAKRIYGFNPDSEDFFTDEIENCIPERESVHQALIDLIEKGKPYHLEFEIIPKDTNERKTIVSIAELERDESGNPLKINGVIHDITDRKRAEEELIKYKQIVSFTPDAVSLLDKNYRYQIVNNTYELLSGKKREEFIGLTVAEYLGEDVFRDHIKTNFDRCLQGETIEYQDWFEYPKMGKRFVHVTYFPYIDINNRISGIVANTRDITALKKVEEELRQAKEAAEAATQAKSRFLALMSHEIRTPMNPIINLTRLLLDTDLTPEQRDWAETVLKSSEILHVLLNDILDLSKIEAGKLELNFTNFSLPELLDETVSLMSGRCKEKGLWLKCHTEPDVWQFLRGDPHRLRQILNNFVGNAVKFTAHGGITVRVNCEKEDDNGITLKFSVTDTGIGIPKDRMARLFKSFSQADSSTSRKYGGTGLGLAISKQLAEMMGGQSGAESTEGKGSTFWFTAVFQKCAESEVSELMNTPDKIAAFETQQLPPLRILLAEDNLFNQKVASMIFKKLGFDADIVSDGKEAVDALEQKPYDLVFTDIHMPVMDGIEATRIIRNMKSQVRNIPIIAMTADAMEGDREKYIALGMNDYVSKPVSLGEILACIKRQFRQSEEGGAQKTDDRTQVFDKKDFLERIGGDETLGKELIGIFLSDVPEILTALKSAAEAGDMESAAGYAHKLKGTFGNISANRLYADALAIEKAAKQNEPEKVREIMRGMEKAFTDLKPVLEKF